MNFGLWVVALQSARDNAIVPTNSARNIVTIPVVRKNL
jgi:hypothetical protein